VFLAALTVVAILTKADSGAVSRARLSGLCTKDALIGRFRHGPRGEVAMIVALTRLDMGVIGQDIFVVLVLMSLFTTLITPIVYRNWFYKEEYCHVRGEVPSPAEAKVRSGVNPLFPQSPPH